MFLIVILHIVYNANIIAYVIVKWERNNAIANWLSTREYLDWADGNRPALEDTDYINGNDKLYLKGKWIKRPNIDGHTMLTSQCYILVRKHQSTQ